MQQWYSYGHIFIHYELSLIIIMNFNSKIKNQIANTDSTKQFKNLI